MFCASFALLVSHCHRKTGSMPTSRHITVSSGLRIADVKIAELLHLLSPAQWPAQVTQDLAGLKFLACIADMVGMVLRCVLSLIFLLPLTAMAGSTLVVVDTSTETVSVLQAGQTVLQLKGAAFGRGGVADLRVQGDGRTPLGSFRIVSINHQSQYHLFFGLDYPTVTQAAVGYQKGIIDKTSLDQIVHASAAGRLPPQNTPLGGNIGIHGVGNGSLWMHQRFNWTQGCVALTNEQIEKLAPWLEIGTRVVIQ